jgi:hypothetical protein
MSFWIYKRDGKKRRTLYTLGVPLELAMVAFGLLIVLGVMLLRRLGVIP